MFRWGIIFLVIALIAAALGFGGWRVPLLGCENCLRCRYYPVLVSLFTGRRRP